jgi:hypothetical protein
MENLTKEAVAKKWEEVKEFETKKFCDFLEDAFPQTLVKAPIIYTRLCFYCDTCFPFFSFFLSSLSLSLSISVRTMNSVFAVLIEKLLFNSELMVIFGLTMILKLQALSSLQVEVVTGSSLVRTNFFTL